MENHAQFFDDVHNKIDLSMSVRLYACSRVHTINACCLSYTSRDNELNIIAQPQLQIPVSHNICLRTNACLLTAQSMSASAPAFKKVEQAAQLWQKQEQCKYPRACSPPADGGQCMLHTSMR